MSQMDVALNSPWWRRHFKTLAASAFATAVLVVILIGVSKSTTRTIRVPLSSVTIATVKNDVFHDATTLQGIIAPRDTIYLDALEGGQVEKIFVQAGDNIMSGQPLLKFRNTQLELDVLDRIGRLIESITQLQSYEKQLEQDRAENRKTIAQINYDIIRLTRMKERRANPVATGYVPREQYDQISDELDHDLTIEPIQIETNIHQEKLRVIQLPKIRSEESNLQKSLNITRAKLGDLTVKAPASGRLTSMDLKIGENRNRGDRLGEITLNTGFKVTASVDEYYLSRVQVGQRGSVNLNDHSYGVIVRRIYPQVTNGAFKVDLDFVNAPPRNDLIPGQAALGQLFLGADRPATLLPAGAFLERSGGAWAFVLSRDGKRAEREPITLGRRSTSQVEVLNGLKAGDRVITSDYSAFGSAQRVSFKN